MMGTQGTPDWNAWLENVWGWPDDFCGYAAPVGLASNVIVGQNPPYTIQDFFGFFAKWGGPPIKQA
jgi:hypothetical protein